jgi:thymidine kinase
MGRLEAGLHLHYGPMNGGKTTDLLRQMYAYTERQYISVLLVPGLVAHHLRMESEDPPQEASSGRVVEECSITSRLGLTKKALTLRKEQSVEATLRRGLSPTLDLDVLFVDECQFLTNEQVIELIKMAQDIRVVCYGLLSDCNGHRFDQTVTLLIYSEKRTLMPSLCRCGQEATMNVKRGSPLSFSSGDDQAGAHIELGGNELYESVCSRCFGDPR